MKDRVDARRSQIDPLPSGPSGSVLGAEGLDDDSPRKVTVAAAAEVVRQSAARGLTRDLEERRSNVESDSPAHLELWRGELGEWRPPR